MYLDMHAHSEFEGHGYMKPVSKIKQTKLSIIIIYQSNGHDFRYTVISAFVIMVNHNRLVLGV